MKEIILDMNNICSADEFYDLLGEHIKLPEYFGRNLDALHDVLTDLPEPVAITLINTESCEALMPKFLRKLRRVLEACTYPL